MMRITKKPLQANLLIFTLQGKTLDANLFFLLLLRLIKSFCSAKKI